MASTEQLERETEQTRARLGETIDELRAMTPGRVLDEILDYAKDGGGEFLRRMGQQVADNPAPAIMIGAGVVWMMTGTGKLSGGSMPRTGNSNANQSSSMLNGSLASAAQGAKEFAQGVGTGLSDSVSALTDQASDAYDALASKASQAATGIQETAASVADSTMAMEQRILEAARGLVGFCKDQPLVLAGLGLAVGAALGAAVPETQAEDRAMGEMSDHVKEHVNALASEQLDTAKRIGGHVLNESTTVLKQELGDAAKNLQPAEMEMGSDQSNFSPIEETKIPSWNGGDDNVAIPR